MVSDTKHTELVAEIAELHKLQLESFAKATFAVGHANKRLRMRNAPAVFQSFSTN
jgi:hypothetical protein